MALVANRRSVMNLFSSGLCPHSHSVRVVLAEKGITVEIVDIDITQKSEDLLDLNPYNTVPTLVDRELVLYDPHTIMEYLDERFPHPPLMPVDPVSRARTRLALYRIQQDWYELVPALESKGEKTSAKARKQLSDSLTSSAEVFAAKPFFLSDEFSLVDALVTPIMWRLKKYRIELPRQAKAVSDYAERMFERETFQASLSEAEHEMRE
jgi:RNA polymerase-associated protein